MKRTGELLRQARESKNLSLNEIALSLKINSKVLSAIENGDTSKLPAKTFLRGFVQSYANYLRTNVDQIMTTFSEEMGTGKASQEALIPPSEKPIFADAPVSAAESSPTKTDYSAPPASPTRSRRKDENLAGMEEKSRARAVLVSAVCVVLVLFIFVTKRMIDRYQRESVPGAVEVSSPLPVPEPAASLPPLLPPTEEAAPPASQVAVPTPPVNVPAPDSHPRSEAPISKPIPPPAHVPPVVEKKVEPPPAPTPPPPPAPVAAAVEKPAAPAEVAKPVEKEKPEEKKKPQVRNLELIIETMDVVEIEYTSTDGSTKKISLGPDKVHTIRGKSGLKLSISNGGAVNLTLNGKDLGVPGDLGKPVKLSY